MNKFIESDDALKAIVSIPGWAQAMEDGAGGTMQSAADAYCYVPLIYRAVNLRTKALQSVPYHLEKNGKPLETEKWPFDFQGYYPETFRSMVTMTESSLLLSGGNIWKKRSSQVRLKMVQWINPKSTEVTDKGGAPDFVIDGKEHLTIDDVVYFRKFNPLNDVGFGIGAGMAALTSSKLQFYLNAFAQQFFEHGAMPVVILGVPTGTATEEVKRLERWFKNATAGIGRAFRAIGLRTGDGGIKPTTLTPEIKSLAMPELYDQAKQQIAQAFEIPQTMLEDAANYATASEHRLSFWHDTVRPEGDFIADVINNQLLNEYGMELKFDWDTMDQFQQDEKEMADAFAAYMATGAFPPSLVASMLGLELPEEGDTSILDQWYNDHFQSQSPLDNEPVDIDEFKAEIRKWQSYVLKRVKRGRDAVGDRSFESDIIPSVLIAATEEQLKGKDAQGIRMIFKSLEGWKGYP